MSAFLVAYVLLVAVAYRIAWSSGVLSPLWWPPTGLALGVLVRAPTRAWAPLLIPLAAALLVLGFMGLPEPRQPPPVVGVVWAAGDVAVPLMGAWLIRHHGEPPFAFQRPREVLVFVLCGVLAPALISSVFVLLGVAVWPGEAPEVNAWGPWWMGEVLGILSIAPAFMTWPFPGQRLLRSGAGRLEAWALLAGIVLVSGASFELPTPGLQLLVVAGATGPLLAWAAIRFGAREAAWATTFLAVIATGRALAGSGPFAETGLQPHERVFYSAGFFSLAMLMSLLVAAFASDRLRAETWQRLLLEATTVLGDSAPLGERLRRLTDLVASRLDVRCELRIGGESFGAPLEGQALVLPVPRCDGELAIEPPRRLRHLDPAEVEASRLLASKIAGACERDRLVRELEAQARRNEESLALLDSVLRSAPVGIAVLDCELRLLRINEAMTRMNEISADSYTGPRVLEKEGLRRVLETGEPVVAAEVSGEPLSRPGEERTWSVTWFPVAVPGRAPHAVCAFASDVTERKRQDDRLRTREERFRRLAEAMSDILFTLDPQLIPSDGSARWSAFTGQVEEELRSERWLEAVHPDDREKVRSDLQTAACQGTSSRTAYRLRYHDGSYRHVESFAVPIRDPRGTIREWVGVTTDVTERVRAEQARERALTEAQEAVQVREDFLSIAAHELKTPLTPLSARLDMIQRRVEAGQPVDLASVQKARAALSRLTFLIGDLLDVTRIRSARLTTAQEPVPLSELVREVADSFREQAPLHRFEVELPGNPMWVKGERSRLLQVFDNLLDNAIKFSPEGGRIGIVLRAEGDQAHLSVSDEGIGIPAQDHADLFDRFFRAHNVSTRSYGGLGLGLYISREIVELHGGRIWLESEVGRGTTFHVTLPLMTGVEAAAQLH